MSYSSRQVNKSSRERAGVGFNSCVCLAHKCTLTLPFSLWRVSPLTRKFRLIEDSTDVETQTTNKNSQIKAHVLKSPKVAARIQLAALHPSATAAIPHLYLDRSAVSQLPHHRHQHHLLAQPRLIIWHLWSSSPSTLYLAARSTTASACTSTGSTPCPH